MAQASKDDAQKSSCYPTSDALMVSIGATADIVRERAEDRF
jgi:hypothetical protein